MALIVCPHFGQHSHFNLIDFSDSMLSLTPHKNPRHPDCPTSVRDVGMPHPPWRFLRPLVASNFTGHTNFVCIRYNLTYMILFEKPLCGSVPKSHSQFVRHRQMFDLLGFLTGGVVGLAFLGASFSPSPHLGMLSSCLFLLPWLVSSLSVPSFPLCHRPFLVPCTFPAADIIFLPIHPPLACLLYSSSLGLSPH